MSTDSFALIKSQISIVDVVKEYVSLKKAGLYLKGLCPFHHEKTGSFTVSPHREIFYCFGCHKGGDLITFVTLIENCTPIQAVTHLAEQYSITLPETFNKEKGHTHTDDLARHAKLCATFASWCHQHLMASTKPKKYGLERNITKESMQRFTLGYFPEAALNGLLKTMKSEGFIAQDLVNASILAEGKYGLYSPFSERIIFPIKDHLGRTIAFGGRVFHKNDDRPKYYNLHDHPFFNKGHTLFGLDIAKKKIQETREVFLVEGYTDCIAMSQAGYTNTVATLGTACTLEHIKQLARYAEQCIVIYDGDSAGHKAIMRMAHLTWQVNMDPMVIILPQNEDPASYLQKHDSLTDILPTKQDIFLFFIQERSPGYHAKPLNERIKVVKEFIEIIGMISDPLKQSLLIQQAAASFNIPQRLLASELAKYRFSHNTTEPVTPSTFNPTSLEKKIIVSLLDTAGQLNAEDEALLKKTCSPPVRLLIDKLLVYLSHKKPALQSDGSNSDSSRSERSSKDRSVGKRPIHFADFLDHLEPKEKEQFSLLVISGEEQQHATLEEVVTIVWKREWKRVTADAKIRLQAAEKAQDQEMVSTIIRELSAFKNKMREKQIV